jgi:hypothetical protein
MTKTLKFTGKVLLTVVMFTCIASTAHDSFVHLGATANAWTVLGSLMIAMTITPDLF